MVILPIVPADRLHLVQSHAINSAPTTAWRPSHTAAVVRRDARPRQTRSRRTVVASCPDDRGGHHGR